MLSSPFPYVITFQLNEPIEGYKQFFEYLTSSEKYFNYMSNAWIIMTRLELAYLGPQLRTLIFSNDRLLILPAKGPGDGWLPPEAWTWINENLPREW